MCDTLCDKKNKFIETSSKGCDLARISLEYKVDQNLITYTVTNTGTVNICEDIVICSYYFGKIVIENELLLPRESVQRTESYQLTGNPVIDYSISPFESSMGIAGHKLKEEKARAYTRIGHRLFIYSKEIAFTPKVGAIIVTESRSTRIGTAPPTYNCIFIIGNGANATCPAYDVSFFFRYTGHFTIANMRLVECDNKYSPDNSKIWYDEKGIYGTIKVLNPGNTASFRVNFAPVSTPTPRFYYTYADVNTTSPLLDFQGQELVINVSV